MGIINNMKTGIKVYKPNYRHELGFFKTWSVMFRNILNARTLIWQLFKRDFFSAYKKSFIGVAWVFLIPLFGIVNWVFLNSTGILQPGNLDIPYPVYVLLGTSCFQLFLGFFDSAKNTLQAGNEFIMQVKYPHEAILFKQAANHIARYIIGFLMTILILVIFQIKPHWKIIFFPLVSLPLFFLGSGLGLIIAMVSVVSIDVNNVISKVMILLVYTTPVIYTDNVSSDLIQNIIKWNPLTYLVCSARDIILKGKLYDTSGYFIAAGLSLIVFLISWRLFFISEDRLIERMI